MELGLLKVNTVDLHVDLPDVHVEKTQANVIDRTERIENQVRFLDESFQLVVKKFAKPENDLRIVSFELGSNNVAVKEIKLSTTMVSCLLFNDKRFSSAVKEVKGLSCTSVFSIQPLHCNISSRDLPVLKVARFKPIALPKDERVIKAIVKVISKEKIPQQFKFVGFYKSVPIQSAKKVLTINDELLIELSDKTSKRMDVLVFKNGQEYRFVVFSLKELMKNL